MTYDANGFLKTSQDWNGATTSYSFDPTGLLLQRIDGQGTAAQRSTTITWNAALRVPLTRTVRDVAANVVASTSWLYNGAGQVFARCEVDVAVAKIGRAHV